MQMGVSLGVNQHKHLVVGVDILILKGSFDAEECFSLMCIYVSSNMISVYSTWNGKTLEGK